MSTIHQGSIEERVRKCLREQAESFGTKFVEIPNYASLVDDLEFDSLGLAEATMAIEDEFSLYVEDEEMKSLTTVQQVIDLVTAKVGG